MGESTSLDARFWARVDVADCWEWTGGLTFKGYGKIRVDGKPAYTHRLSWQLLVGPIAEGLQLDHLCRNRRCCNPDHLEPVTCRENLRRSHAVNWARKLQSGTCPRGHDLAGDNLYVATNGSRHCRICRRAADRRRYVETQRS